MAKRQPQKMWAIVNLKNGRIETETVTSDKVLAFNFLKNKSETFAVARIICKVERTLKQRSTAAKPFGSAHAKV